MKQIKQHDRTQKIKGFDGMGGVIAFANASLMFHCALDACDNLKVAKNCKRMNINVFAGTSKENQILN